MSTPLRFLAPPTEASGTRHRTTMRAGGVVAPVPSREICSSSGACDPVVPTNSCMRHPHSNHTLTARKTPTIFDEVLARFHKKQRPTFGQSRPNNGKTRSMPQQPKTTRTCTIIGSVSVGKSVSRLAVFVKIAPTSKEVRSLYSLAAERQTCKLKVPGSIAWGLLVEGSSCEGDSRIQWPNG